MSSPRFVPEHERRGKLAVVNAEAEFFCGLGTRYGQQLLGALQSFFHGSTMIGRHFRDSSFQLADDTSNKFVWV